MSLTSLTVTSRPLIGKHVARLRRVSLIPAVVYGKSLKSVSLSVSSADFTSVYKEVGETGLVELVDGSVKRPVLVHSVQVNPVSGNIEHIEFHQVNLKEKVHANVPIVLVGSAPATQEKVGIVLQLLNEVEVEALPADLPPHIEVSVVNLAQVNDQVTVGDLTKLPDVTILTEPQIVVVRVGELVAPEKVEAPPVTEAVPGEAAAVPVAEGDAPTPPAAETK